MRIAGDTPFPPPRLSDSARRVEIPSRDVGRKIPCRVLKPQHGNATLKAVFLHLHGGGWVLGDEESHDPMLQSIADRTNTIVFSVGYRLAPENPFPCGPNDCFDGARWLIDNSQSQYSVPLGFIGGESAGAHLSMLTALDLLQCSEQRYSGFRFKGALLHYGCYALSFTPSVYLFEKPSVLILDKELMEKFLEAFLPDTTFAERQKGSISPLYADLEALRGKLPPALFTCGTEDCLVDDTIFMSAKWLMAGAETTVKIITGAPHGYLMLSEKGSLCKEGLDSVEAFMLSKLSPPSQT